MKYIKFSLIYFISSIISSIVVHLIPSIDFENYVDGCLDTTIVNVAFTVVAFIIAGIVIKEKFWTNIIIFLAVKAVLFIFSILLDGSFVSYLEIYIDSLYTYLREFLICSYGDEFVFKLIALIISMILPISISSIPQIIKKAKTK